MDLSTAALIGFLAWLCFISAGIWLFYAIFGKIVRATARTTRKTAAAVTGTVYKKF